MMSSPESHLKPDQEIRLSDAANLVQPTGSESKQERNTTSSSQAESLLAAEKRTLEMMANGASLPEVLNDLCAAIDAHAPPATSMVCLMDGEWLLPCAGPRVPATFKAAITPWRIGPDRASCGAAAFTKQTVIVPNISNDPRWPADARDLTLRHGFSAAWSEPLISKDGEVLGTLAMYYPEPRTPQSSDLELINRAGYIARIAIETERSHLALKKALVEVKNSENRLRTIIDTIPTLAWSAGPHGSAEFFNQRWLDYTGLSLEQAQDRGWEVAIHPDDLPHMLETFQQAVDSGKPFEVEGRFRRHDGECRWFLFRGSPLLDASRRVVKWYGTNIDLEDRKRAECLLDGENLVLEMTAKGNSLEAILEVLCRVVEQTAPGCCCSVMLIDPGGSKIQQIVAPSIPSSYNERFVGKAVDREGSPCTKAAHHKTQVIVPDVVADTQWDTYGWRTVALTHGLKACWSTTILASDGVVLGTFGIYWREPRNPTEHDQKIIEQVTHLTAVVIERKRNELALQENEERFRLIVDTIPGFVCTLSGSGEVELLNRQVREYFGKTIEELRDWANTDVVHPDDLPRVVQAWRHSVETGQPHDLELRQRRADGVYRWFHSRALPTRDAEGRITAWYMLLTDIDDRKRAEEALRENEQSLRLIIDSIPGLIATMTAEGDLEVASRQTLEYFGKTIDELKNWATNDAIHPDDLQVVTKAIEHGVATGQAFEYEIRGRRADGVYRWYQVRYHPQRNQAGQIVRWYILATDIDRKRAEDVLRASEDSLRLVVNSIPGLVFTATGEGEIEFVNQQILDYSGKTFEELKRWHTTDFVHPDDLPQLIASVKRTIETGQSHEIEHRLRRADGTYRWFDVRRLFQRDSEGRLTRWYMLLTDIDDRKQAEDKLRRSEADLLEAQRLSHTGSWRHNLLTGTFTVSPEVLRMRDVESADALSTVEAMYEGIHPDDRSRVRESYEAAQDRKGEFEAEYRLVLRNGTIKHLHMIGHPVFNESGEVVEYVGTGIDVTEQTQARMALEKALEEIKRLKDRLHDENVALKEQIDQAFMFEEIVGSSPALKTVVASIMRVAPTDSTVLITGETGTGKELIARAIHKGSHRAGQPFITANCASIPSSLIASELFGHEKGAFTGALQRRQGRFELAHSGTIFLDEIGELPAETQVALLRVLQERQFERVGGNRAIPVDVRIIAATNRDLTAAIAAGTFRADLFYRLNVFPIAVPPLRNRREDIPMLVEYFVKRYAEKAGKQIGKIDKNTMRRCQSYDWPGNIRELQNIVERSVILCAGDTFWIDAAWLSSQSPPRLKSSGSLTKSLQSYEKELIEAALAESNGKVAGPNGAAAKLGIPRSTLDLKIRQLDIKKHTIR
jgi:PAS domain S-box-containing protein